MDKGSQKSKLHITVSRMGMHEVEVGSMLTRSTGVIVPNVAPPDTGFLLSQSLAHCVLCA